MKIAVVVPIGPKQEKGGAEVLYDGLVSALNNGGHYAKKIEIIVDESSFESILEAYCECFYYNLDNWDLVISTKAPTYMIRHRNHISYFLHPIRVFYDMFESECESDFEIRKKQQQIIYAFDKYGLDPIRIKNHFTIGTTVAHRMCEADPFWEGVPFEILYPAPFTKSFLEPKSGDFIFLPGRLHRWKRIDLIIESMQYVRRDIKLVIVGTGEDEKNLRALAQKFGLEERIQFLGAVSSTKLLDLYSRSIVVPFVPIQEDYGYVTIEAFNSKKPVITCNDSGEPSRIVQNGITGFIVNPNAKEIADKINFLVENPNIASDMGFKGYLSVQNITWENVISRLLEGLKSDSINQTVHKIKVLIADMQPIEPAIGGGRLRLKGLYSNLGDSIEATYVGTYDWQGEKNREIMISDHLKEIDIPLSDEHFRLNNYLNDLLPGKTIIDSIFPLLVKASPEYVRRISEEAKKADVIIISHPWLYPLLKTETNLNQKIVIYDSHNFETVLRKELLGNTYFGECIANFVKFVEWELCEASELILTCSNDDSQKYNTFFNLGLEKMEVFPNGVDGEYIKPVTKNTKSELKKKYELAQKVALFIGSDYPPNIKAGEFILNNLADQCPDIQFLIIGTVGNRLKSSKENVRIVGMVTDEEKRNLLWAADIAINPMFQGSGTNIKMFDYLAAGLPTISTPIGARGIINEGDFIIADSESFPEIIQELFFDKHKYEKFAKNGRQLIEKWYDWANISHKLGMRIRDLFKTSKLL